MARPNRIKLQRDGASYHVMTRTVTGSFFFQHDFLKEWLYRKILWLASIYFVELHAIAVMSNHYHIVLSVRKGDFSEEEIRRRFQRYFHAMRYPRVWSESQVDHWRDKLTDLSEFMKDLNQTAAAHINKVEGNRGHVWGGRFKSVLIEDGVSLLACMAYVELNGVRAGLCKRPSEYRWCSAGRFQQAGHRAAGVKVPKMSILSRYSQRKRSRAFGLLVDHLAAEERGEPGGFPTELGELDRLVEELDLESLLSMVFHRTQWARYSLVLGTRAFCRRVAEQFQLRKSGSEVYVRLGEGLYNSHQRPGHCLE